MNNTNTQQTFEIYENPSLNQLYDFVKKQYTLLSPDEQELFNKDTFNVIEYYIYGRMTGALHSLLSSLNNVQIQHEKKQPTFYLGGHNLYNTDEPITQQMIDEVQNKIDKTDMSLCWGQEIYSVMEHNRKFADFKTFYKNYKEYIEHLKYLPGNVEYFKHKKHFESERDTYCSSIM